MIRINAVILEPFMNQLTGLCLIHLPYFNHAAASGKPDTGLLISRYDKDESVRAFKNITSQIAFQSKPIGASGFDDIASLKLKNISVSSALFIIISHER
jgi:hypothetical protein